MLSGDQPIAKPVLLNRDRLMNADAGQVGNMTVLLFDRLQGYTRLKEDRLLAHAAAFTLMCEAMDANPQEVFSAVKALMLDPLNAEGRRSQFNAMGYHLREDILR